MMDCRAEYMHYGNPLVRSLVWCLLSPNLLADGDKIVSNTLCRQFYDCIKPDLLALDKNPESLIGHLEKLKSRRLGLLFEAFWNYLFALLKTRGKVKEVFSHIQVRDQQRKTLGELDYLLVDAGLHCQHWEIAVKFYLYNPALESDKCLVGPNGKDWFRHKYQHMLERQLGLSASAPAQKKIQALASGGADTRHVTGFALMKGMIFYPFGGPQLQGEDKRLLSGTHLQGCWLTISHWLDSAAGLTGTWLRLKKPEWLLPLAFEEMSGRFYTTAALTTHLVHHFKHHGYALMITRMAYHEDYKKWVEQQRFLIVND